MQPFSWCLHAPDYRKGWDNWSGCLCSICLRSVLVNNFPFFFERGAVFFRMERHLIEMNGTFADSLKHWDDFSASFAPSFMTRWSQEMRIFLADWDRQFHIVFGQFGNPELMVFPLLCWLLICSIYCIQCIHLYCFFSNSWVAQLKLDNA